VPASPRPASSRARGALRRQAPGEAVTRAAGRALVALCTALGATFIKVGQIASTRADLLPRPLIDELALLRDRVPPFPFAAVRATVEAELGRPDRRGLRGLRAAGRGSVGCGLANVQVTLEIGRIFDILRRHRIQARSHMTMVNLALMTAEGLGKRLAPGLSLTDAALPYLSEALAAVPDSPQPSV
jgi:predicted unusual protein kinase regulating ubiquinone biosynthesis (AarF/ABC1/UbiB family)